MSGLLELMKTAAASATGTRQRYERAAKKSLDDINELLDQLSTNTGKVGAHLVQLGFMKTGNRYVKGDTTILVYRKEQLRHYLEEIFSKVKESCCVASTTNFNCSRTYLAIIDSGRHYFFSPDFKEPRPLQVPRSQMLEHLKMIVDEIESQKKK